MTTKRKTDYNIGDRVAERPKSHGIFAGRNEVKDRIQKYRGQRYGTVVGINIKTRRNGSKQKFLLIQWDHLKSPTEHAQMRICPIDQLVKLQSEGYGFDNVLNQRRAEFSNVDNHLWSRPLHLNVRRQVSIKPPRILPVNTT